MNLFGLTLQELQNIAVEKSWPSFTAKQIAQWIYAKGCRDFSEMTNLSMAQRQCLSEDYSIFVPDNTHVSLSQDGTKKYLYPYGERRSIETAYIPEEDRATLCVSSQVGCKMGCLFCMTAKQGFQGNLSAGEIVGQYAALPEKDKVTNFVYMGMGEPMDNLDAVLKSLEILTADWGYGFPPKKITVSTIGLKKGILRFLKESECHLALSLHSPFPEERASLMPIETVFPAVQILDELQGEDWTRNRRFSIEYIVFGGLNHSPAHAKALARILQGLKVRINLIPYHPVPGTDLQGAKRHEMEEFQRRLKEKGIMTTIRRSRGLDIDAACGLLSTKKLLQQDQNTDF